MSITINRRALLTGLGATAATAATVNAVVAAPVPNAGDIGTGAQQHPDDRIAAALEIIKDAFAEKYPGWRVQVDERAQRAQRVVNGQLVSAEMHRHGLLIFAADESQYPQHGRWFVDYSEQRNV